MDSDSEDDPALLRKIFVDSRNSLLNVDGASDCIDGAGKFGENTVACGVGRAAIVLDDLPIHGLAMSVEQAQGPSFISAHQTGVARHVGAEDRCEAALRR